MLYNEEVAEAGLDGLPARRARWPRTAGSASRLRQAEAGDGCARAAGGWRCGARRWRAPAVAAPALRRRPRRARARPPTAGALAARGAVSRRAAVPVRGGARPAAGGGGRGERADGAGAARAVAAALRGGARLLRLAADRRRGHRRRGGGARRAAARRPAVPRLRAGGRGDRGDQLRRGRRALRLRGGRRLRADRRRDVEPAERRVCLRCHQGDGPIFARPLWSETNANPAIAARLGAARRRRFHGAPVRADGGRARGLRRRHRPGGPGRRWRAGCGPRAAATRPAARRCSTAAVRVGARRRAAGAGPPPPVRAAVGARWPDGLGAALAGPAEPRPAAARRPDPADLETEGALDPETPREPAGALAAGRTASRGAARLVAELRARATATGSPPPRRRRRAAETVALACETRAALRRGRTRFACAGAGRRGFVAPDGPVGSRRAGSAAAAGARSTACRRSAGSPGCAAAAGRPRARRRRRSAAAAATLRLIDDLGAARRRRWRRAPSDGAPALGDGPFAGGAVLALIARLPEAADG